ncbi:hypothetical protein [Malikia sp.]|uniref:hypothetical protein n=1 Tax=Malikia sp. TaxID=2070706 RepID=UPI002614B8C1|nr:hypothetical protein [Malikia sp.]MDD2729503.1 hypothetical protein [Malikia sp.]
MTEYTAALKQVADAASQAAQEVAPALHHAADRVSEMASDGMSAIRQGSRQCRDQMARASSCTVSHIRQHPTQTIVIAALLGATAVALLSLLRRR